MRVDNQLLSLFLLGYVGLSKQTNSPGGNVGSYYNPQTYPSQQQQTQYYDPAYQNYQNYGQQPQSHDDVLPSPENSLEPEDPLPPGWTEYIDQATGRPYYYNENDGTTTWERPTAGAPRDEVKGPDADSEFNQKSTEPSSMENTRSESPERQDQISDPSPVFTSSNDSPSVEENNKSSKPVEEQYYRPDSPWGMPPRDGSALPWGMPQKEDSGRTQAPNPTTSVPVTNKEVPNSNWGQANSPPSIQAASTGSSEIEEIREGEDDKSPVDGNIKTNDQQQPEIPHSVSSAQPTQQDIRPESQMTMQMANTQQTPPNQPQTFNPPNPRYDQGQNYYTPEQQYRPQEGPPRNVPPYQQHPQHEVQNAHHQQQQQQPWQRPPHQTPGSPVQHYVPIQPQQQQLSQQQTGMAQEMRQQYRPQSGQMGIQQGQGQLPNSQQLPPHLRQQQPPYPYGTPGYGSSYPPNGSNRMTASGAPPPSKPHQPLIIEETGNVVREALGSAWQGILGFGNRTKEVIGQARETVVKSAAEVSQTVGSTTTGIISQARSGVSALFESNPNDPPPDHPPTYSMSGRPPPQFSNQGQNYNPQQGQYNPQQGQYNPQQGQYNPQQQQGQLPQPRGTVPYPGMKPPLQYPPPQQTNWQANGPGWGAGPPPQRQYPPSGQVPPNARQGTFLPQQVRQGQGYPNQLPPQAARQHGAPPGQYPPQGVRPQDFRTPGAYRDNQPGLQPQPEQQQAGGSPQQQQQGRPPQNQNQQQQQKAQPDAWQHPGLSSDY